MFFLFQRAGQVCITSYINNFQLIHSCFESLSVNVTVVFLPLFPSFFSTQDSKPEPHPAGIVPVTSLWVTARSRAYLQGKATWQWETFREINLMDFILLMLFWKDTFEVTNMQYRCKQWGREAISLALLPILKLPGPHPNSSHLTLAILKTVFIHSCFETAKRGIWIELWLAWGGSCFNQTLWVKMFAGDV